MQEQYSDILETPQTIDTKQVKKELLLKRQKVQNWLTDMDLDVSYTDIFSKNREKKIDDNHYLFCSVNSMEKMDFILSEAKKLGYICEKGSNSDAYNNGLNFINMQNHVHPSEDIKDTKDNKKSKYVKYGFRKCNFSIDLDSVKI